MSHPPVIDGFQFASTGATQQGVFPAGAFSRLREILASDAGNVAYELRGLHDARGRPALHLRLEGWVELRCQRCLEPMRYEVRHEGRLVLAATQADIDADPKDTSAPDRVLAGRQMGVLDLVEDELLLELPYAPRHERCAQEADEDPEARTSAFANLRGMLQSRH